MYRNKWPISNQQSRYQYQKQDLKVQIKRDNAAQDWARAVEGRRYADPNELWPAYPPHRKLVPPNAFCTVFAGRIDPPMTLLGRQRSTLRIRPHGGLGQAERPSRQQRAMTTVASKL
jgi:hypothetical protein